MPPKVRLSLGRLKIREPSLLPRLVARAPTIQRILLNEHPTGEPMATKVL